MVKNIVVSFVAGFTLLGTTLAAAQCPPNLKAEEIISCIVSEGAGAAYQPATDSAVPQARDSSEATTQSDPVATDNGALTTAQVSH